MTETAAHPTRKSIELFAGAGGLGIGLAQAGFIPQKVVEFNKWCCETLRSNDLVLRHSKGPSRLGSWDVVEADVRSVDFIEFSEKVDLISGGPPCQPFSLGGRHAAHGDQRDMFPQAVRAVREARPKAFVFENVKGLTRQSFVSYFEYIKLQLEHPELTCHDHENWEEHLRRLEQHHTTTNRPDLHYRVVTRLLNAANFGVPQKRERVIFVGFRDDVNAKWSFERGAHSQEALIWDQVFGSYWDRHRVPNQDRVLENRAQQIAKRLSRDEKPELKRWKTTRDAIADLPDPENSNSNNGVADHRFQPNARIYAGHTGSFLDEPSKTLKAGVHGVPGGENMLRRADGSVRYFTVREAARLQTFPDNYQFHGAWSECMRQLGNAVPATLARVVGQSISEKLNAAEAR